MSCNKCLFFLLPHLSEMPGTARTLYRVTAMPQPFLERIFEKICAVSRQGKSTWKSIYFTRCTSTEESKLTKA
jgi:hypothetical protein